MAHQHRHYSKVEYQNVYPGINLVYYGNQEQLEYDYQLAPGADPSSIRFAVQGADSLSIDAKGNLVLHTAIGDVVQNAPVIYQIVGGVRQSVAGQFVLLSSNEVGFQAGSYDAGLPLTIDPILAYSSYLGGSQNDFGTSIAVDATGNVYVAGDAGSGFPTTTGAYQTTYGGSGGDAFVSKMNAAGTALVYSSYLGGGAIDTARGIAVDGSGNAFVTGETASTNFPTTSGAYQTSHASDGGKDDTFVTKLNASGAALVYSTYLGGNNFDDGKGIAVDNSGNAYVAGGTQSSNFPTTADAYNTNLGGTSDAFITKLNANGTALVYSTYLGSTGNNYARAIALDSSGNAHITGVAAATFPTTPGAFQTTLGGGGGGGGTAQDAFVTTLNASGTGLIHSTFLGGNNVDAGYAITLDGSGNTYVTGSTYSTNFPTTSGAFQSGYGGTQDAFVAKLNADSSAMVYATYLGGNNEDYGNGIAVDGSGYAYVTGTAWSANFPTTSGALQTGFGGTTDAFVTKLNLNGTSLVYSTYLGGSGIEDGTAIALDNSGNAYIAGDTGSSNFPTTAGSFDTTFGPNLDAFVAKFDLGAPTITTISPNSGPLQGGTLVSISGTNLNGNISVTIGGVPASNVQVNANQTQITCTTPASAVAGNVAVTVTSSIGGSVTLTNGFTYVNITTTVLVDNGPNPSSYGQPVILTATVSGGSDMNGETIFVEDADNANALVASPTLNGGSVTFTISDMTVGTHDLFAVYNGDAVNAGSNSSATPVTQVVIPAGPAPVLASVVVNGGYGLVINSDYYIDGQGYTFDLSGQNSVVVSLLVTFNEPVTLDAGAFAVTPEPTTNVFGTAGAVYVVYGEQPNQLPVAVKAPVAVGGGSAATQWVLTFSGAGTTPIGEVPGYEGAGNILKDGVYQFNMDGSKVHAYSQTATSTSSAFWTMYGAAKDLDGYLSPTIGDGASEVFLDCCDVIEFNSHYLGDSSNQYEPPSYDPEMDADLSGYYDGFDVAKFNSNFLNDWTF